MSSPLPRGSASFLRASIPHPAAPASTRTRTLGALILVAAGLGLAGCPGSLDPSLTGSGSGGSSSGTGGSGPSVCDAPTMVFKSTDTSKGCGADNGCHGATGRESGLDLVSAGVVARLLDKAPDPTLSVSCMGSTEAYLKSGSSPATGLLIDKLGTGACGLPMPYPLGGLPQQQKDCITQWANAVTTGMITQ